MATITLRERVPVFKRQKPSESLFAGGSALPGTYTIEGKAVFLNGADTAEKAVAVNLGPPQCRCWITIASIGMSPERFDTLDVPMI